MTGSFTKTAPLTIAIAGCSGSGKSTLAKYMGGVILPVDAYYRDLSHLSLEARSQTNFDDPRAIEDDLLLRDFRRLAAGEAIARPVYDFSAHTRANETKTVHPEPMVILEGLFALYWKPVRDFTDVKVFVELEDDLCFERRLARDTEQRNRSRESVKRQYVDTVRPMAERFVLPTKAYADLVVRGDRPPEESARRIREWITENLKDGTHHLPVYLDGDGTL